MRFYTVLASRPEYYDRNPLDAPQGFFQQSLAPHTLTTRFTYTVPTARKAFVNMVTASWTQDSAGSVVGVAFAQFLLTPAIGSAGSLLINVLASITLGASAQLAVGSGPTLLTGDVLVARDQDGNTTGTKTLAVTAGLSEFDQ